MSALVRQAQIMFKSFSYTTNRALVGLLAEYRKLEKDTKTKHRLCDQENRLSVLEKENVFLKATVHEVNHELESLRQVLRAQSPRAAEVLKKGSIKRPKPQHAASRANKKIRK
jgi:cell division protein FtsB